MATTEDGIWTPDQIDDYNLVADLATMSSTVQGALEKRANTYTGTSVQRNNFTSSAPEGTIWVDTNGSKEVWVKQGNSWQRIWGPGGGGTDYLGDFDISGGQSGSIIIPPSAVGKYQKYTFTLSAAATSTDNIGTRPVSLRPNGDSGEHYRATATVFDGGSVAGGNRSNNTAYPRTMYIGEFASSVELTFIPRATGDTDYGTWTATGFLNSGASVFYTFVSSGRWQGTSDQPLSSFTLITNTSTALFKPDSFVRVWGHM